MGTESSHEPLLLSSKEDDNSFGYINNPSRLLKSTKYVLKSAMWFIFIAWASFLFFAPSDAGNELFTILLHATTGTLFGVAGSIFLIYSAPLLVIVFLAIIYLRISGEEVIQNRKRNKSAKFRLWTFPVIINGPLGVVTAAELIGILLFGVYIIWAVTVYTIKNISQLPEYQMTHEGGR